MMTDEANLRETPSVLVTGGAGYIGSHVVLAMIERGWRVLVVDDLSTGSRSAVPRSATLVEMDCGDPRLVELIRAHRVEVVVHIAGVISTEESVREPLRYYATNFCATQRLLSAVAATDVKGVVYSSTAAVYGETHGRPVSEKAVCRPVTPYGRSKLASEWMLRDLSRSSSLRHVIFRYFNVAGADQAGRAGPRATAEHLIKLACEAAVGLRREMTIHGDDYDTPDGTCIRDYIHVTDLALAHVAAVEHLLNGGESLTANCGYGRGFSVREVLETALALADEPFRICVGPRRPGDAVAVVASARVLGRRLTWRPEFSELRTIIETGMDWERLRLASRMAQRR
jgi:UDP-glucose 4-epimerase